MLPTGLLSGVELPVTSKYVASLASNDSGEFLRRVSLATVWKGAWASFHATLAFSIQKLASRVFAPIGHFAGVEKLNGKVEPAHQIIFLDVPDQFVLQSLRIAFFQRTRRIIWRRYGREHRSGHDETVRCSNSGVADRV